MSEVVRSWFAIHPDINCITWPPNSDDICPISQVWESMITYVDNNFPLTAAEIKKFIFHFWYEMKGDPDYFHDLFAGMKKIFEKLIHNRGGMINF